LSRLPVHPGAAHVPCSAAGVRPAPASQPRSCRGRPCGTRRRAPPPPDLVQV